MARKANIAKEEIYQACWELLEKNTFPNIPRLTEFFLQKDGRCCSNTTFMSAIIEWEGAYKEHQEHYFKELNDVLLPVFKHFSREVTQKLGQLLDEKSVDLENHQIQKKNAIEGGYLSLSSSLIELQSAYDTLEEKQAKTHKKSSDLEQKGLLREQRYQDVLAQSQVLTKQFTQKQTECAELRINLAQKEVDLAKLDNKLDQVLQENQKLLNEINRNKAIHAEKEKQNWQQMNARLDALSTFVQMIQDKDVQCKDRGKEK